MIAERSLGTARHDMGFIRLPTFRMKKFLAGAVAATSIGMMSVAMAQDTGSGDMMDADDTVTTTESSSASSVSSTTIPSELPATGGGALR